MKKSFCVFLASLLLLCLGTPLEAETTSDLEFSSTITEPLEKEDFETEPSQNWSAGQGEWGKELTCVADPLDKTNQCIKIEKFTDTSGNPYIQRNFEVAPGATYEVSARVYSDQSNNNKGEAYFNLTFAGKKGSGIESLGERAGSYSGSTGGKWKTVTCTFTVPMQRVWLYFAPRQKGIGYIYFDDISIKMIERPNAIQVETDEVFYYSDHTEQGIATATMNVEAYPALSGKDITFRLLKEAGEEDEIIGSPYTVAPQNNSAVFSFPVVGFELQAEYYVKAQIDGYDDPRCTATWKIYRYSRPACMDENGVYYRMIKNAETGELKRTEEGVQPVFAYRCQPDQLETVGKNGISIAQLTIKSNYSIEKQKEEWRSALDKASDIGMMCMIPLYWNGEPAGSANNVAATEEIVKEFYNHEALFAWMVMDETFSHFAEPFEDLRNSYKTIRDIDPYHPVYLCEATTRLEEAGRYADILCVDPYPAPYRNDSPVYSAAATFPGERVKLAIEAVDGKKPVYSLLQAFRWTPDHADYFPTGDEMRNMLYQSLLAGASGVGYYNFDKSDGQTDLSDTDLWPYITSFSQNEQKDAFDAFVYGKYPIFSDVRKDDYWSVSFLKEGVLHMVVLNRLKTEQTISMSFANFDGSNITMQKFSSLCVAGSEDEAENSISTLTFNLPPCGAALYKLTPEKDISEKNISLYLSNGKAELYNKSGVPVQFVLARYRIDGIEEVRAEMDDFKMIVSADEETILSLKMPDNNTSYAVKAFAWSTTSYIAPFCSVEVPRKIQ